MRLINEQNTEMTVLSEGTGKEKSYWIKGVFIQPEIVNANKRLYPAEVVKEAVEKYYEDYINKNRALGELGHRNSPEIDYDRVSHKIVELKEDSNGNYIGKAKVLSNLNCGKIVKGLLDEGITVGVSTRGLGTYKENEETGYNVVEKYIICTAADIVFNPSAPDAFVSAILENKDWVWENPLISEKQLEEVKRELRTKHIKKIEKYALGVFDKFLQNL